MEGPSGVLNKPHRPVTACVADPVLLGRWKFEIVDAFVHEVMHSAGGRASLSMENMGWR
jgi:hypothetical protein